MTELPRNLHGTNSAYSAWACRCEACREAHRVYQRNYRAVQKALRRGVERRRERIAMDALAKLR